MSRFNIICSHFIILFRTSHSLTSFIRIIQVRHIDYGSLHMVMVLNRKCNILKYIDFIGAIIAFDIDYHWMGRMTIAVAIDRIVIILIIVAININYVRMIAIIIVVDNNYFGIFTIGFRYLVLRVTIWIWFHI